MAMAKRRAGGHSAPSLLDRAEEALKARRPEDCLRLTGQILASPFLKEQHARAACLQAAAHVQAGDFPKALPALLQSLKIDNQQPEAWHLLALCHKASGKIVDAFKAIEIALGLDPRKASFHRVKGQLFAERNRPRRAAESFRTAVTLDPRDCDALFGLGRALETLGDVSRALEAFRTISALMPSNDAPKVHIARILAQSGATEEAVEIHRDMLRADPNDVIALEGYLRRRKNGSDDEWLQRARVLTASPEIALPYRINLLATVGASLEKLGRHDEAFDCFSEKNRLSLTTGPWDRQGMADFVAGIEKVWTADLVDSLSASGLRGFAPVLIVGMPRSGTTLTETILGGSPLLRPAGELPELGGLVSGFMPGHRLDRILEIPAQDLCQTLGRMAEIYAAALVEYGAPGLRVIDKMPENFKFVGLAAALFPDAKIIHCLRTPEDTCLSIYKHAFVSTGHRYAYDLEDLGAMYRFHHRLMEHWKRICPGRILTVRHEAFVADPERIGKSIADHVGIAWDPALLDISGNRRSVATASSEQIRSGINARGVGVWRRYASHLGRLQASLGDLATR